MNTKNIFRTLFMAVLLLVGANCAKADTTLYDNPEGSGSYGTINIQFGALDDYHGGVLKITYDILPQDTWTPTYQIQIGSVTTATVTESGVYEITLDDDFFEKVNTTDQYNICTFITPLWVTIYKIEVIGGSGSSNTSTYTLFINIDGETTTKSVAEGTDLLTVLPTPTKTGHTFTGWSGLPEDGKMPANDLTVTAQFTINSYKLTYMVDNEIYGDVETYEYGATITPKAEPTKPNYTFSGWSGLPTTMPANDVTVTGRFIKDAVYVPAEISDAGYATFCSTEPLDFSGITTLKAYYAIAVNDTAVTFRQVTGTVAAGTGLLLVGTTSQVLVAEAGNECTGNLLVGVLGNDEIVNSANKYVLVVKDGKVKFADTAAQAATVPAGKAYLQAPSNSRILTFSFDGEATGISAVNTVESQKQGVYNLQGQRVTTMNKGLYIINGKKVMIK